MLLTTAVRFAFHTLSDSLLKQALVFIRRKLSPYVHFSHLKLFIQRRFSSYIVTNCIIFSSVLCLQLNFINLSVVSPMKSAAGKEVYYPNDEEHIVAFTK